MADAIRCDVCSNLTDTYPRYTVEVEHQFGVRSFTDDTRLDVCSPRCLIEYARRHDPDVVDWTVTPSTDTVSLGSAREDLRFTMHSLGLVETDDETELRLLDNAIRRIDRVIANLTDLYPEPDDDEDDDDA